MIRGDDHLNNAARQLQMIQALGWPMPVYAHVPLIHGPDGAKLSKRHGALAVEAYRDMGYLPEAMRNYLLRLGWSHGDEEIISTEQAIAWFDLEKHRPQPGALRLQEARQPQRPLHPRDPTTRALVDEVAALLGRASRRAAFRDAKSRLLAADAGAEGAGQDDGRTGRRRRSSCSPMARALSIRQAEKSLDAGRPRTCCSSSCRF